MSIERINTGALRLTRLAIFGLFFSLFFSRSLFVLCGLLAMVGWLLSGQYRARVRLVATNPAAAMILLFLVYVGVSAALTFAGANTVTALKIYWQLLLIPVIATTMTREGDIARCWNAYAAGASILLVHVAVLPWYQPAWIAAPVQSTVFFNPLPQAVSLAIFAGWCVYRVTESGQRLLWRFLLVLGFAAASWAVLFVSQQRLGFLSWAVMVSAGCVLRVPARWRWQAAMCAAVAVGAILLANDTVRGRMLLGIQEFQSYDHKADFSSIGARRYFWSIAWTSIQEAPWLGHGTGSYRAVSCQAFDNAVMCEIGSMHPHQQYLMLWLELGVAGLLLFVGVLGAITNYHLRHARFHPLALPVLVVFCLSGFVDTPLWYRGFLYLFVPLLGLLAVQLPSESKFPSRTTPPYSTA
jgi:O-antigen ligase